ncbi:hypothetical protein KW787_02100 [Candidatus Pacearchaeota archaeon]|nr:hypothetical protein [Candidatus Pacearchaeota archaeon]
MNKEIKEKCEGMKHEMFVNRMYYEFGLQEVPNLCNIIYNEEADQSGFLANVDMHGKLTNGKPKIIIAGKSLSKQCDIYHESGHFLHYLARPDLYSPIGSSALYFVGELVAEYAALSFAKKEKMLEEYTKLAKHPIYESVLELFEASEGQLLTRMVKLGKEELWTEQKEILEYMHELNIRQNEEKFAALAQRNTA